MHLIPRLWLIVTIFGATAMMAPVALAAQLDCATLSHSQIATVTGTQTTSSKNPVNVPGAAIKQKFFNDNCIVVEFSAQIKAKQPNAVLFTAVSTGQQAKTAFPAAASFSTAGNGYDGRAMTFIFPRLTGENTISIRFESLNGSPVSIKGGVMKVLFNNEE
jgi:hypothetical protein